MQVSDRSLLGHRKVLTTTREDRHRRMDGERGEGCSHLLRREEGSGGTLGKQRVVPCDQRVSPTDFRLDAQHNLPSSGKAPQSGYREVGAVEGVR